MVSLIKSNLLIPIRSVTMTFFIFLLLSMASPASGQSSYSWKVGGHKSRITPESPLWMAGYASRDQPAQGKYGDLWLKVLALEDQQGNRVIMVSSDLLGFPKRMSDDIRTAIYQQYGLSRSQVILNSSHTHSGPVLEAALFDIYPLKDQDRRAISAYSQKLEKTVVESVGKALANMKPSKLYSGKGTARFQVNRRNNKESDIHLLTELKGPMDHAVPVIKISDMQDRLTHILFGYACHPTVLSDYQWSGDFPGYAQEALETNHPGAMALFFQGAAGDQNPLPRRSLSLAVQYGNTLAAAVDQVLAEKMTPLASAIQHAYQEIDLALQPPPGREELKNMVTEQQGYMKTWALRMLEEIKDQKPIPTSHPFPLQILKLGEYTIFNMGGEATIGYANKLKEKYGPDIFVMAYSNDVMGYIPTEKILEEGGYEGYSSQMVYGLPNAWKPGLEEQILDAFDTLARQIQISPLKSK